ncbi:hypothetical protein QO003_000972 [Arthrobacter silviterrae]|uniref:DUF4386 family protein n=1 Tax=Arthrobacter silviterrae TaxID=2026658 RepID=A0ABX0DEM3_9MICC|nr:MULTISPECIES: hypothetical protein [Arthrobacter]MCU6482545.1 hypothetical protein [Arthrobacter sp. A2-55]MDQ0276669.1 hypothetical protein [Arthrobacter silviterrae]NGN85393.1 hypothetical protein [Arthrobacter silviterrae]
MHASPRPGPERLLRIAGAAAITGGPACYLLGGLLAPAIHGTGAETIEANTAANASQNAVHLAAFVAASYLLPMGAVALAWLAYRRTPWLAVLGGLLGVIGWAPFSALAALDDLASVMSRQPGGSAYAGLLDDFTNDPVMGGYLIVYVICHLAAYVLLGIALRRARIIPWWFAWAMIASSPLTIAAFAFHNGARTAVGVAALALLLLGSLPAARAIAFPNGRKGIPRGSGILGQG